MGRHLVDVLGAAVEQRGPLAHELTGGFDPRGHVGELAPGLASGTTLTV
jgi:hypothetical protein